MSVRSLGPRRVIDQRLPPGRLLVMFVFASAAYVVAGLVAFWCNYLGGVKLSAPPETSPMLRLSALATAPVAVICLLLWAERVLRDACLRPVARAAAVFVAALTAFVLARGPLG